MASFSSSIIELDVEESALKSLLDAFGSMFSLEDISSAFCKAGRDVDLAGEILYAMRSSSDGKTQSETSSESSNNNGSDESYCTIGNANLKALKSKQQPVSMGTVSSVLGKNYVRSTPWANKTQNRTKPLKLEANQLSTFRSQKLSLLEKDARLHKDFENFLFEMLGNGFQLDRDVIREVLGHCGYDMEKSIEELLDPTTRNLDEIDNVHEGIKMLSDLENPTCQKEMLNLKSTRTNGIEVPRKQEKSNQHQKEILDALFSVPERCKPPERACRIWPEKSSRAYGQVVTRPLEDVFEECKIKTECNIKTTNMHEDMMEDEEDSYQVLRQAVKEYRATMKEYYKAAAEAFAKGDRTRAGRLMQEGQFFYEKACKADDESAQKISEISGRDWETQEESERTLDLQNHDVKEAIRLVKCHLCTLSGIPSFTHLKIITGMNGEEASKGARKQRLVIKLLEKESIKWTEDETSRAILIQLDEINPKRLSFAKK
ncbi:hypothetical protein Nepgr_007281 [Nepenthes gracilis]|uniref:DUF1771 domain-containing protein n=1 Tax=Nepenthes gracilis TaxID=150966 RepID=A0AAD3S6V6_NEPGR|nr:hypothetical protein Nepgr_007281 [Nepenthes gracilis]